MLLPTAEQLVCEIREAEMKQLPTRDLRERLWGMCADVVTALAVRYTGHAPGLKEDFLGEGYLKFEQVLGSYDPNRGVPFRGYLANCIERHFHDQVRKKRYLPSDSLDERAPADGEPDELARLRDAELGPLLRRVLRGLLPNDRRRALKLRAFELRHLEGWSVEAIRAEVGAPNTNTVSQWLHRTRRELEAELLARYPEYAAEAGALHHRA